MTSAAITARLGGWISELEALIGPDGALPVDDDTRAACVDALRRACADDALSRKVAAELNGAGAPWVPVGRVLLVIAENDVLGTVFGVLGACLTGNQIRVKARHTRPIVTSLAAALGLDDDACTILDWSSATQDDTAVLNGIDAVIIAGGDAVIRHYRRVTPTEVRLIEWGPKLSAAAIGAAPDDGIGEFGSISNLSDITNLGETGDSGSIYTSGAIDTRGPLKHLIADVTLFGQRVCSSPQFILVDDRRADALYIALAASLHDLPRLADEDRLAQHVRAHELTLRGRLDDSVRVTLSRHSGWGVTLSDRVDPSLWLHRGFALIRGDIAHLLAETARRFGRRLQTLGTWDVPAALTAAPRGFTRVCPLGAMHMRPPFAPHDGAFELPPLVDFLAHE